MAYAFLKALGCDGNIGTITVEYGLKQATATPGQEIVSYNDGTVDVKSTRYPFCFFGQPDKAEPTPAAVLKAVPFNEDLNRYMLVVKGLTTDKTKVTWGKETKEFASADLAKGINLAAEFLANPFFDQFTKVDQAVHAQEDQEQLLVQGYLNQLKRFKEMAPDATAPLDQAAAMGMAQRKALFDKAQALVVPIEHTIKIEPVPNA